MGSADTLRRPVRLRELPGLTLNSVVMNPLSALPPKSVKIRRHLERLFPLLTGTVLVIAAIAKFGSWIAWPHPDLLVFGSWTLTIVFVLFEFLLGMFLIFGVSPGISRQIALAVFVSFAAYSGWKVAIQSPTCGCFGYIPFPPVAALILDVAMIVCLMKWKPAGKTKPGIKKIGAIAIAGTTLVLLAITMSPTVEGITEPGFKAGHGDFVLVQFHDAIGKRLPISPYLLGPDNWSSGRWTMFFFREECEVCKEEMSILGGNAGQRIAFVEVPPHSDVNRTSNEACLWLRLSDSQTWLIDVPTVIALDNGIVTDVR
jgi:hypothetical protein